jgi:futalosine hydrolase
MRRFARLRSWRGGKACIDGSIRQTIGKAGGGAECHAEQREERLGRPEARRAKSIGDGALQRMLVCHCVPIELAVCFATDLEGALLRERLNAAGESIAIIRTGFGPVNAAHAVTLLLAQERPHQIVVCGVGGAYPSSGMAIGDVACAETECYGDLGATSPAGFLDMEALGFPIVESPVRLYNTLPMQVFPAARRARFVTVTSLTGTNEAARSVEARTGGAIENMEGAAVAHVARLHGVDVGELRGVSNIVGDRDARAWRIKEAALAAQEALCSWIARR